MTRIIDNTFDFVIFSLNMRYAIISTKTGSELKSTAAIDSEIVFIAILYNIFKPIMPIAVIINSLISLNLIFNCFLSVARIAITITGIAIENLKNSSVVASIPFCVNVLTNMPLDP